MRVRHAEALGDHQIADARRERVAYFFVVTGNC
jgi:hypothetical protein